MRRQQTARARAHGGEAMAGAAAVSHSDRNARTTRVLRGPGPIPQKKASKQRGGMAMTPRLDFYGFSPAAALSAAVCLEPVGRWWCSPIGNLFFCVQDRRKTEGEGGGGSSVDKCVQDSLWRTLHFPQHVQYRKRPAVPGRNAGARCAYVPVSGTRHHPALLSS